MEESYQDFLAHYGTPRHSGRYPWGSGENPYQRLAGFMGRVQELRKQGLTDAEIAKSMGMNSKQLRARYSYAKDEKRMADAAFAWRLKEKGYSNQAIADRMGLPNESSVRSLLDPAIQQRTEATRATATYLKDQVKSLGFVDVGAGTELYAGVSKTKLDTALEQLQLEGYEVHNVKTMQLGTGKLTTVKVLCPPGTSWAEVQNNQDKIKSVVGWSEDGGQTWELPKAPVSIDSKRLQVCYGSEGGKEKDGVIELRRGVEDISLGDAKYAQVRIAVDGTHYLKGMAVYSDDLPSGVDLRFNTNKEKGASKLDALKEMKTTKDGKVDLENPFGATIKRQRDYIDKDGKEKQSAINIVNEEGDWAGWKKTLSSQMLSKQSKELAEKQLALRYDQKQADYEEIKSLTNPVVKKKLLQSFADECDSSSVHLEAAAMPRQASHVILPLTSIKDTEIYAPNYKNGEKVVLIRYPHGGKFEIPELVVNNKNNEGKNLISNKGKDAVGISSKVAERLSGADFDGDTVLVIPNNKSGNFKIKTQSPLDGLKNFDPKESYPGYDGMKVMTKKTKGLEMGKVSNLITDMTIKGANDEELARAVRHSMVVIDAEKHKLNYKQSFVDNGIAELYKKYQGKAGGGAATIVSRASGQAHALTRRETIDPKTGKKVYIVKESDTYTDKNGKTVHRTIKSTQMAETDNAFTLVSGGSKAATTPMEAVYATHANKLKALANQARKDSLSIPTPKVSQTARKTYAKEVSSLMSKLNIAEKNAPKERQAQLLANSMIREIKQSNPNMDNDDLKKAKSKALTRARATVGAKKELVNIEPREWEAIQAHAITKTTLERILNNADESQVKKYATPKDKPTMTSSRVARARAMLNAGCTIAEVADTLGVSTSTISRAVSEQ